MNIVDQSESVYESSAVVISLQSQTDIGTEGDFINNEFCSVDPFMNDIIEDNDNLWTIWKKYFSGKKMINFPEKQIKNIYLTIFYFDLFLIVKLNIVESNSIIES